MRPITKLLGRFISLDMARRIPKRLMKISREDHYLASPARTGVWVHLHAGIVP
jgi:hypothetical protein